MGYPQRISVFGVVLCLTGEILAKPPVPRPAAELTLTEASGGRISLADYAGKVLLVQCLFTTCPHCQATSKVFAKLQNELGSRGLQVVGVAFNEEAERDANAVRAYAESNGVGFPLGVASRESVMNYLGLSFMTTRLVVPQVVVIDRNGIIRAQSDALGSEELMDEARLRPLLESLLGEAVTGASKSRKRTAAK